jgi:bifunctional DNA-binding transcriptional regulator/antitoxin component of YhaV-PrlF toxin-antitoxin module
MKTVTSRISSKGQTTLPKEIREVLSVDTGDLIQYEVDGNIIKIRRLEAEENIWLKSIESTLEEWQGSEDDDL